MFGLLALFYVCAGCNAVVSGFTLTVMHTNDLHAHIEESTKFGAMCGEEDKKNKACVGGVARITTKVKELKKQYPGALFLNSGDFYQGTAWYSVLKHVIISAVMSKMGYDFVCLGNHEFDDGPAGLAPFLQKMKEANVTVVNSNADFSKEPALANIRLPRSVVADINGTKVGIVGAVLPQTKYLSAPGAVEFEDEVESFKREIKGLKEKDVNIIIAITHSGYPRDIEIVKQVKDIDLLVGGHTNTFLYHGTGYPRENTVEGDYPTVVNRSDGSTGLIVQDFWFGKFLGFLQVKFNESGHAVNWTGNPILLNSSVEEDSETLNIVNCYKPNVTKAIEVVVGYTKVLLEQANKICRLRECNLGNLIADSFFAYYADMSSKKTVGWSDVNGALINGGSVRAPIPQYGFRVKYDVGKHNNNRVKSLEILCRKCKVPRYEAVNDWEVYRVVTTDYVGRGGDGYRKATSATSGGPADYTVLVNHIKKMTPIKTPLDERIIIYNSSDPVKIPGDPITGNYCKKSRQQRGPLWASFKL
ncbi:protein 5NUC-like isoform X3 [Haemaphysalis longicornis]